MDILIPFPVVNQLIMIGTVVLQIATMGILLCLFLPLGMKIRQLLSVNALALSFIVSLGAVLGSLYYSDIVQFPPCVLCWYQRIALYPIPLLLFAGFLRNDRNILLYTTLLSIVGALIAKYHMLLPFLGSTVAFCNVLESGSCLTEYVKGFGYITIPVMSLSIFAFLIVLGINALIVRSQETS